MFRSAEPLVGAVVLLVHETGGFLLELVEIHDDGCSEGRGDIYWRFIKAVEKGISLHVYGDVIENEEGIPSGSH